jgi:hypothetical protein
MSHRQLWTLPARRGLTLPFEALHQGYRHQSRSRQSPNPSNPCRKGRGALRFELNGEDRTAAEQRLTQQKIDEVWLTLGN